MAVLGTASAELLETAAVSGRVLAACSCIALTLASYITAEAVPQVVRDWTRVIGVGSAQGRCLLLPHRSRSVPDGNREVIDQRRLEELTASAGDLFKHVAGLEAVRR